MKSVLSTSAAVIVAGLLAGSSQVQAECGADNWKGCARQTVGGRRRDGNPAGFQMVAESPVGRRG